MAPGRGISNRGRGRGNRLGGRSSADVRNSFAALDSNGEMNADLAERFKGPSRPPNTPNTLDSALEDELDLTLNLDIRDYVSKQEQIESTLNGDAWLSQPEIPTNKELFAAFADLTPNKIGGPYKSKDRYLKTHYELIREDAIGCFRDAIHDFRKDPSTGDTHTFSVYDQVHIVGFTFSRRGLAARIRFSTRRAGKQIKWENSKRLVSGSIVALLPTTTKVIDLNDMVVATVAARPLQGVMCEPPEIDIHFGRPEDIQLDPQKEWLMIEAKQGYFEAYRHTLRALQKLSQEKFPLSAHICHLERSDEPPAYIQKNPVLDLSAAVTDPAQKEEYLKIDVTKDWPAAPSNSLDSTQWEALREILTKRHPIVQGPPGTGKTYVSRVAVEIMHANRKPGDPPIIIAAQTNHALDQLLGHISVFEPNYIRLGGRSTKPEVKKRALFEIRQGERIRPIPGGLFGKSNTLLTRQTKGLIELLEPLVKHGPDPWSTDQVSGPKMFQKLGILTAQQAKSLEEGATQWVSATTTLDAPIRLWLGKSLVPFEVDYVKEDYGFEEGDDVDLEFEQLRENEDSTGVNDQEDIDMLKGPWRELRDQSTVPEPSTTDLGRAVKLLDTVTDMWSIPDYYRAHVYHVMQSRAKAEITTRLREDAKVYNKLVKDNLVGKWEQDVVYLRRASIIGMTTTGLSKYRPLISALKPKVILIEEAAEVLEAPITVACTENVEHLILVGDHQQLQGHCSVQELENEPFYLNVSLFERLVRNEMPYKTLLQQRRMMPEFCRLVASLYPSLSNHSSVVHRRLETWGTGEVRSFFFDHPWWEAKDASQSIFNPEEAKFVAGFYRYLCRNGLDPTRITVLTFYNGQRKRILRELKEFPEFRTYVNVKTVDSYQGEENNIVLLSLARNNQEGKIGFLENVNRTCVALSRAKYGFYIFGNSGILMRNSVLWQHVITLMDSRPRRRGEELPVMCKRHNITTLMSYPEDWEKTDGGCAQPCGMALQCGHSCHLLCHPYPHDSVQCRENCGNTLPCGHGCSNKCGETCFCPCDDFSAFKQAEAVAKGLTEMNLGSNGAPRDGGGIHVNGQEPPTHGSTSYLPQQDSTLDRGNWQLRPASERGLLDKYLTDQQALRTEHGLGGTWNPTLQRAIHTTSLTPENQVQLQRGWKDFAEGGFIADDERLENLVAPFMPPSPRNGRGSGGNFQMPPVTRKAVKVLSNGRISVLQEYQPGPVYDSDFPYIAESRGLASLTDLEGSGLSNSSSMARNQSPQKAANSLLTLSPAPDHPSSSKPEKDMIAGDSAIQDLRDLNEFFRAL